MDTESKRIIRILVALSAMLISLVIYLSYFEIFQSKSIEAHSYNRRQWLNEENVLRGSIVDRNGKALAHSEKDGDLQTRVYKYGSLYSHIIGYSYREYGKAGLEASYNKTLIGADEINPIRVITEKITGPRKQGNNLILTIDHGLQEYSEQRLKGKKGSIVLMNPQNGEIYAMVSKPDFNPVTLRKKWEDIIEDKDSPLINRATMGLYAPGSVFKVITAAAALENRIDTSFKCEGSINIDGYILKNFRGTVHGPVDLTKSLAVSCNVAFAQMGLQLGESALRNVAEDFLFNEVIPFDLVTKSSVFPKTAMTNPELGATAIGQGKLLTTPLNMALVASAVANEGVMMKPLIVKEIITPEGKSLRGNNPEILQRATSLETARDIKGMMVEVVKNGTGKSAAIRNIQVAGKTGTAENETGKEHAWFIGFAPADNPRIAVAVILENAGTTGGASAAPIARDVINKALNRMK